MTETNAKMSKRLKIRVPDNMEVLNAKVDSTFLGVEDNGILTFTITVGGDGWGQGFGTYGCGRYDEKLGRQVGTEFGMESIARVLDALEVAQWEKLKGTPVRIIRYKPRGMIVAIGNYIKDKWFNIEEYSNEYGKEHPEVHD